MNQHGNRSMASQELSEAQLKNWHDKNPIILPGKPVELNFVMLPAGRVIGKLSMKMVNLWRSTPSR